MKKLFFILMGLMLSSSLVFGTITTAEAKTKPAKKIMLKLSSHGPPVAPNEKVYKKWADLVAEKTEGRVTIKCFFGGVLAKAKDAKTAVETGVVDIAFVPNTEIPSLVPRSLFLETPMLGFTSSRMGTFVFNELINSNPAVANEYKSVKVLMAWLANPRYIHMVDKEIRVPADLKGKKLLAWGVVANLMETLGAAPVQQSPADWYTSLDRGLVEGIVTASFLINIFKVAPVVTKHTLDVDLGWAGLTLLMNHKSWNKLPEDVKSLLENELNPWALDQQIKVDEGAARGIAGGWKAKGHTVIHPTADEIKAWNDAVKPLHKKLITEYEERGLQGQELYDSVQNLIKKYGK